MTICRAGVGPEARLALDVSLLDPGRVGQYAPVAMMPKLLLADDSITVQRVIALTFQGEGIEVIAVGDGDQAVDAIDRERPQIVLADLSMPGRDGYAPSW